MFYGRGDCFALPPNQSKPSDRGTTFTFTLPASSVSSEMLKHERLKRSNRSAPRDPTAESPPPL